MGIREGMLALLAREPKHGYQLKLDLEEATASGVVVNIGQIYSTLQRLERDGLVLGGDQGDDDGRVVYTITDEGREELEVWGDRPEALTAGRDELSIKILIALYARTIDPHRVVSAQRSQTMRALQDYTRLRLEDGGRDVAWQLHLDRLIYNAEAELKWLDRVEERLPTTGEEESDGAGATPMEEVVT
jgi:DNA-binding PadR family transcriptional regulator